MSLKLHSIDLKLTSETRAVLHHEVRVDFRAVKNNRLKEAAGHLQKQLPRILRRSDVLRAGGLRSSCKFVDRDAVIPFVRPLRIERVVIRGIDVDLAFELPDARGLMTVEPLEYRVFDHVVVLCTRDREERYSIDIVDPARQLSWSDRDERVEVEE